VLCVFNCSYTVLSIFISDSVRVYYADTADYYVIEIEDIYKFEQKSDLWKVKTTEIGYSGEGYLLWEGPISSTMFLNKKPGVKYHSRALLIKLKYHLFKYYIITFKQHLPLFFC
jgi:hypothetical protein